MLRRRLPTEDLNPNLYEVRQTFDAGEVEDPYRTTYDETGRLISGVAAGSSVGITAGSRGIADIAEIYRAAADAIRDSGCEPFLFSSMGSHGGGTAEGQREVLASLGVTEESVGARVVCSGEVQEIGETVGGTSGGLAGLPVYVAREAIDADAILAVNRIKPHTSFHGEYESGLLKMLSVGLGRAAGASMVHSLGWENMVGAIRSISEVVLREIPVAGGLAVVQNGYERPAVIEGIPPERLKVREPELLDLAREYLPRLPVDDLDLLVVLEIGKNFSGTGMDPNVIGRLRLEGIPEPEKPRIRCIAVLDLSEASHGNATGVGLADLTTKKLVEKIDRQTTYLNCLTSGGPQRAAIPMTFDSERELLDAARRLLKPDDPTNLRVMMVKNTLDLETVLVSETVAEELRLAPNVSVSEKGVPLLDGGRIAGRFS